ncbi:hypothetical protein Hanom_Chr09g00868831 [Helianthus anomalus]
MIKIIIIINNNTTTASTDRFLRIIIIILRDRSFRTVRLIFHEKRKNKRMLPFHSTINKHHHHHHHYHQNRLIHSLRFFLSLSLSSFEQHFLSLEHTKTTTPRCSEYFLSPDFFLFFIFTFFIFILCFLSFTMI